MAQVSRISTGASNNRQQLAIITADSNSGSHWTWQEWQEWQVARNDTEADHLHSGVPHWKHILWNDLPRAIFSSAKYTFLVHRGQIPGIVLWVFGASISATATAVAEAEDEDEEESPTTRHKSTARTKQ